MAGAGGSLRADDAGQSYHIQRHASRHVEEDQLDVTDEQGIRREGRPLALLLDGVDESIFNNVFAFGLGEIQHLATLTDSAAADLLYELTLGLDRVSLADVVHELDGARRRLLTESDGSGQIAELIERREQLRGEIRELKAATPRFLELVRSRQELDRAAGELESQESALDLRLQQLALAQQIEPRWRHRQQLERQLDALGTIAHIADDCLPKLEDLKARAATRRDRAQKVFERRKELIGEMGRMRINDALCRQAPRIEALAEQQTWIGALDAQARQLEAELAEMTAQTGHAHAPRAAHEHHAAGHSSHQHGQPHESRGGREGAQGERGGKPDRHGAQSRQSNHERAGHERAGHGGHAQAHDSHSSHHASESARTHDRSQESVPLAPLTPHTIAALRSQGKALRQLRQRLGKAKGDKASARQTAQSVKQQISTGRSDEAGDEPISTSLERSGTLVSQLRRRVQIDERLDQLDRRRHELEEKTHDSLDRQVPPAWQILSHGVFFMVGIALLLASIFLPSTMLHGYGMVIGFLGLISAGVGWAMTYASHHMAGQQFEDCTTRLDQLKEQQAAAEKERDELDKQLPKGGGPLVARLQAAEAEQARLEELVPQHSQHQHTVRTYKAARDEHRSALGEYKKARRRWRAALIQAGLSGDLTPRQLRTAIERGQQLQALGRKIEERRAQLVDCRRQHEILAERILQVAVDSRLELDESDPLALLRELVRRLQDEQLRVHARDQLKASLVRLRRVRRKLSRQLATVQERVTELVHAHGARDEDDLRRRIGIQDEARRLQAARQGVDDEISPVLTDHEQHDEVAALLDGSTAGDHDLRSLADAASSEKHALRERLGHVWEERGALLEQIKSLAADRRLAGKRLELSQVQRSLRRAIGHWQVLGTCSAALDRVREVYERQRQPEVLREASELFARLTGGRYTRAWSSLGHRVLWVDDAQGKSLAVERLSRGTREQLFLSLRLALVSAYARRGVRLPVVMDDVLVNFDAGRVRAAVDVLRDFVRAGHQILLFTCHEHIASLFRHSGVDVRALPGNVLPGNELRLEERPEPEPPAPRVVPAPHFLPLPIYTPPQDDDDLTLADLDEEPPVRSAPLEPLPHEPLFREPVAPEPFISEPVEVQAVPIEVVRQAPRPTRRPRRTRPAPQPAPVRQRVRREQWVDNVPWSAEEFDGELADRVRRSQPIVDYVEEPAQASRGQESSARAQDDEPLDVEFDEQPHLHRRNGSVR